MEIGYSQSQASWRCLAVAKRSLNPDLAESRVIAAASPHSVGQGKPASPVDWPYFAKAGKDLLLGDVAVFDAVVLIASANATRPSL